METVNNNQFEVKSSKRKIEPGPNVYLNPALNILVNEDPMCNNAMEITPKKKTKRTKSCSDISGVENTALDIGINKAAVNELLVKELENVKKVKSSINLNTYESPVQVIQEDTLPMEEPIYANLTDLQLTNINAQIDDSVVTNEHETDIVKRKETDIDSGISIFEPKSINTTAMTSELENNDLSAINNTTNVQTNVTNQIFVNHANNLNLSFIDRLALDSPMGSNKSLYLDDDLNESNIMEIKTITIITKKKIIPCKRNTNPFLEPNLNTNEGNSSENPFIDQTAHNSDLEYNGNTNSIENRLDLPASSLMPRRLFTNDTNSTISTVNDSSINPPHEYENIDSYRSESPIYENIEDIDACYNKQSKILGCDVSQFRTSDIMDLKRNNNNSNDSTDSKKDLKHQILKASNKLSRKVFKTLKKKFKGEKMQANTTLNPYEVPRKPPKQKSEKKDSGIENPALFLDNSDEIEIEELDEEPQYETVKTIRNTQLNTNVTPLKERNEDNDNLSQNRTFTPGKKVRFDSTLNREKVITGNSFDCSIQSPGFDVKIDKYQDELENCINERKFIQQNM